MSVKLMGAIFELDIPSSHKLVLLAMADHARDDGTGCYPSMATLAKKTSLTKRATQRIVHRLRDAHFISDTNKISKYQTVEYEITLDRGDDQRSLVFPGTGATAKTEGGDPGGAKGATLDTQKGSTRVTRTKNLSKDLTTKDGTGRANGGGSQDAVTGDLKAAAACAFAALGLGEPYGHPVFQAAVVKRAPEKQNGNLLDVLESIAQDLEGKCPPKFFDYKHTLENEMRELATHSEARVGSQRPDRKPEDQRAQIREWLKANAARIRGVAKKNSGKTELTAGLASVAKLLDTICASLDLPGAPDLEGLERQLAKLDEEIATLSAAHVSEELGSQIRRDIDQTLAGYRRKMKPDQAAIVENQFLQKRLLEAFQLPRLSLYYMEAA